MLRAHSPEIPEAFVEQLAIEVLSPDLSILVNPLIVAKS